MNPYLVNMLAYFSLAALCLAVYLVARWAESREW
jgi:hypothetical protein